VSGPYVSRAQYLGQQDAEEKCAQDAALQAYIDQRGLAVMRVTHGGT